MAACGSLQHIFENPLPENPTTLLESLSSSWKQIKPVKPIEPPSFTEIFGELHFKENSAESSPCPVSPLLPSSCLIENLNINDGNKKSPSSDKYTRSHQSSDRMSSDSLQLCTEGLGFESSDDVEDMGNGMSEDWKNQEEKIRATKQHHLLSSANKGGELRRSKTSGGAFPPPISCIGKSGKPWVCFKSYRQDGRFVLKEIRIPTQEFLRAYREDGRLKLHFVQPNDEILEEEEEEEEEEEDVEMDDEEKDSDDDDDKEGKEDDDLGRKSPDHVSGVAN